MVEASGQIPPSEFYKMKWFYQICIVLVFLQDTRRYRVNIMYLSSRLINAQVCTLSGCSWCSFFAKHLRCDVEKERQERK